MAFNKENAATHGSKGGSNRWRGKNPATNRNKKLLINISPAEYDTIAAKAKAEKVSKAELIVRAVTAYEPEE